MRIFLIICALCFIFEKYGNGVNGYVAPICGEKGIWCNEQTIYVFTKKCNKPPCEGFKLCRLIYTLRNIFLTRYICILEQIFESLIDDNESLVVKKKPIKSKKKSADSTLVQKTIAYWLKDRKFIKEYPKRSSQKNKSSYSYIFLLWINYSAIFYSLYNFLCSYHKKFCQNCMPQAFVDFEKYVIEQIDCYWNTIVEKILSKPNEEELEEYDDDCSCTDDDQDDDSEECNCPNHSNNDFLMKLKALIRSLIFRTTFNNNYNHID